MWIRLESALLAAAVVLSLTGCNRISNDPATWLTIVIPAAAAIAFYLQILKDW